MFKAALPGQVVSLIGQSVAQRTHTLVSGCAPSDDIQYPAKANGPVFYVLVQVFALVP